MPRILIPLLFLSFSLQAQVPGNTIFPRTNQLKFSLVTPLEMENAGWELSYEKQYAKRLATQVSFRLMSDWLNDAYSGTGSDPRAGDVSGFALSLEQKYFIPRMAIRKLRLYLALSFRYLQQDMLVLSKRPGQGPNVWEDYLRKKTFSVNAVSGIQRAWGRWMMDMTYGVGLKQRTVESTYVSNQIPFFTIFPNAYETSNELYPNLVFNFKVGYLF
ncbi:hypothetical protein ACWKWU_08545 [Chitinophaga lutea]